MVTFNNIYEKMYIVVVKQPTKQTLGNWIPYTFRLKIFTPSTNESTKKLTNPFIGQVSHHYLISEMCQLRL
jgi:hypothetical protein